MFRNECLGEWNKIENEKIYLALLWYYYNTEKYDRKICNTDDGGSGYADAIPRNKCEKTLIEENAKSLWKKILRFLDNNKLIDYYKGYFNRITFYSLEKLYDELEEKMDFIKDDSNGNLYC